MSKLDVFYPVLDDCIALYTNMLEFENSKYTVIVQKDITSLEEMLKVEQALIMKSGVLEKRRVSTQAELGFDGYTLLEMAEQLDTDNRSRLLIYREKLLEQLNAIKSVNSKSMQILNDRLRTTERRLELSGYVQDMHTYNGAGTVAENNDGINKSLISKSI